MNQGIRDSAFIVGLICIAAACYLMPLPLGLFVLGSVLSMWAWRTTPIKSRGEWRGPPKYGPPKAPPVPPETINERFYVG